MNIQTLSVKEAAVIFKVKPKTIRAWIAQGKLAASRIGRAYLIPADEVGRAASRPAKDIQESNQWAEIKALLRQAHGKINMEEYAADFRRDLDYYRKVDNEPRS